MVLAFETSARSNVVTINFWRVLGNHDNQRKGDLGLIIAVVYGVLAACLPTNSRASAPQEENDLRVECAKSIAQDDERRADAAVAQEDCVVSTRRPSPRDPAAQERGRALFVSYGCIFCHGKDAQGT